MVILHEAMSGPVRGTKYKPGAKKVYVDDVNATLALASTAPTEGSYTWKEGVDVYPLACLGSIGYMRIAGSQEPLQSTSPTTTGLEDVPDMII